MAGNHWIHVLRRILRVPLNVPRPVVLFGVSRLKIVSTETADEAKWEKKWANSGGAPNKLISAPLSTYVLPLILEGSYGVGNNEPVWPSPLFSREEKRRASLSLEKDSTPTCFFTFFSSTKSLMYFEHNLQEMRVLGTFPPTAKRNNMEKRVYFRTKDQRATSADILSSRQGFLFSLTSHYQCKLPPSHVHKTSDNVSSRFENVWNKWNWSNIHVFFSTHL